MRRLLILVITAAAGARVLMLLRAKRTRSGPPAVTTGVFPNGMAYAKVGDGPKTVIAIPGGPGNAAPTVRAIGPALPLLIAEGFTCWAVTRRRGMPIGHTVADMADDFATLIAEQFGGRVDLVLGTSMGGMIGFYLAARHPAAVGRLAAVAAAARTSDEGRAADLAFARALAEGRMADAMIAIGSVVAPQIPPALGPLLAPVLMPMIVGDMHPAFASDVIVEAEACETYDAREVLPSIAIPVLVVGGDRDRYFPLAFYEETARLIPGAILRIHAGRGHMRVIASGSAAQDVIEFARQASPADGPEA